MRNFLAKNCHKGINMTAARFFLINFFTKMTKILPFPIESWLSARPSTLSDFFHLSSLPSLSDQFALKISPYKQNKLSNRNTTFYHRGHHSIATKSVYPRKAKEKKKKLCKKWT